MTQPTPPTDRQFARDVARQIDRRRVRRRLTLWSALLALVAAGAAYLRCGSGFGLGSGGFGGNGGDAGDGAPQRVAGPRRCAIRVSAAGITIHGQARTREQAIDACKAAPGVDIFPTGDARHGDLTALGDALTAAGAHHVVIHPPGRPVGSAGEPAR